jgi:hypothetical protein
VGGTGRVRVQRVGLPGAVRVPREIDLYRAHGQPDGGLSPAVVFVHGDGSPEALAA